jgi:hypothetical protein
MIRDKGQWDDARGRQGQALERDDKKWEPVFVKNRATTNI